MTTNERTLRFGRAYSSQAEHPDPTVPAPAALIVQDHAAYFGAAPAWPTGMIEPSDTELARWSELWLHGQAGSWVRTQREQSVAALVRLEQRCAHRRPSAWALTELERLRTELGLAG
jgi:hypothetical protein